MLLAFLTKKAWKDGGILQVGKRTVYMTTVVSKVNQFTLQAGTYLIQWVCPAYATNRHNKVL